MSFLIHNSIVSYDINTDVIKLHTLYVSSYFTLFIKVLKYLFRVVNVPVFIKLKFKGKGYYLYKNLRNTITPQFNYAHVLYVYSPFISVKFLSKTSVLLFGFIISDLLLTSFSIKNMRKINIFTGRGVRFSKQIIYKKTGKVSSYR